MDRIRFHVNDQLVEEGEVPPTTTLLQYLRRNLHLTGTKEGCAEGDCGACTVAFLEPDGPSGPAFRAVNACLVLLPMVQGRRIYTVEGLKDGDRLHPVQRRLAEELGSQCGYCTPGVVMAMFEACYRRDLTEPWQIDDQMCGNLCRCTGYRPIREAARAIAGACPDDRFSARLAKARPEPMALAYARGDLRYWNPTSLDALWDVLERHPDARIVCGGTDLSLEITKRFRELPLLVSVEAIPDLKRLERRPDGWHVGAAVTLTDLHDAVRGDLPALDKMLRFFASRQIRNRATVGGNLCNASPIGDLAPVLLALGAEVRLASRAGRRTLPLDRFFVGYRRTALRPGEVLEAVRIPHPPEGSLATSFKVSKRRELDISTVAAGCFVRLGEDGAIAEARIAFGGMAPIPARARSVEAALIGRPFTAEAMEEAAARLAEDFRPISDHRGSAWYRLRVAGNLLRGFVLEARNGPRGGWLPRPTSTVHLEAPR